MVTDLHNHLIPGVDDGARDIEASAAAIELLREQGVGALVTTPHVDGSLTRRPALLEARLTELDDGWERLRRLVADRFDGLSVARGAEIMLDTPQPDFSDPRLRLAGTSFVLIEFPHMVVPPRSAEVLRALAGEGWMPVVAHPERYGGMLGRVELTGEWRAAGAYLQVNGPSLLGGYAPQARRVALELLERGWIDLISSDYHAHGRPRVASVRRELERLGGQEQARLLMETNPRRVMAGELPLPVPPLATRRGFLGRLTAALRGG